MLLLTPIPPNGCPCVHSCAPPKMRVPVATAAHSPASLPEVQTIVVSGRAQEQVLEVVYRWGVNSTWQVYDVNVTAATDGETTHAACLMYSCTTASTVNIIHHTATRAENLCDVYRPREAGGGGHIRP